MSFDIEYKKLNQKQKEAVDTIEGPVMVVAGPGTGKTQVLALRIANILKLTDSKPQDILCLTFTDSGRVAMRRRLESFIGFHAYQVKIHTFHSFTQSIIDENPDIFLSKRKFETLTDINRIKIMDKILLGNSKKLPKLRPFGNPDMYKKAILGAISNLKREGININDFEKIIKFKTNEFENNNEKINKKTGKLTSSAKELETDIQKWNELLFIYKIYENELLQRGFIDFEDMINFVVDEFEKNEDLRLSYQEKFLYIHVDEYQDTNGAQNKIIKLLTSFSSSPNIFAVGDDDQSIYRFQGANVENILAFEKSYENVKTICINQNYRSTQKILNLSDTVINKNQKRLVNFINDLDKNLISETKNEHEITPSLFNFQNQEQEIYFIANKIKELHTNGVEYKDIAILFRKNHEVNEVKDSLEKFEIPYNFTLEDNLLSNELVRKILNYARIIDDTNNSVLVYEVLNYDFLGFESLDLYKLSSKSSRKKENLFDLLLDTEFLESSGIQDVMNFQSFAYTILDLKKIFANTRLENAFSHVIKKLEILKETQNKIDLTNYHIVSSFISQIRNITIDNPKISLRELLLDFEILEKNKISLKCEPFGHKPNSVNLKTLHGSKGLEFDYVFIPNLTSTNFEESKPPVSISLPSELIENFTLNDDVIEDERRLLFVGITRAKKELFLSFSNKTIKTDSIKENSKSALISDIDDKILNKENIEDINSENFHKYLEEKKREDLSNQKDFNDEEKDFLTKLISNFALSPSALNTYLKDPHEFFVNYLLKVPRPKEKSLYLGHTIHEALECFFKDFDKSKNFDFLLNVFKTSLENEFLPKSDFEETYNEGEKILKGFYENFKDEFTKPLHVEYEFFSRSIYLDDIKLTGVIDKIELLPGKSSKGKQFVKLIDYKTSLPKSRNEIIGETKNSQGDILRQLTFYKLLTELDPKFPYEVNELEVIFLKPNSSGNYKKETFSIDEINIENLKKLIKETFVKIRNLEFN